MYCIVIVLLGWYSDIGRAMYTAHRSGIQGRENVVSSMEDISEDINVILTAEWKRSWLDNQ